MAGTAGGGSSSPDMPAYIKDVHENWLRGAIHSARKVADDYSVSAILNNSLMDGTNPYSNASAYNARKEIEALSNELSELRTKYNEMPDELTSLLSLATQDIGSKLNDSFTHTLDGQITGILGDAISHAVSLVGSNIRAQATVGAKSLINDVEPAVQANVKSATNAMFSDILALAKERLSDPGFVDASELVDMAMSKANDFSDSILRVVLNSIYDIVESQVVNDLVNAYDDSTKARTDNSIGRISAMAGKAGAALTSSFALAKAYLEGERLRSVAEYEAKVKMTVLEKAMDITGTMQQSVYGAVVESFRIAHAETVNRFNVMLSETIRAYVTIVAQTLDYIRTEVATAYTHSTNLSTNQSNDFYRLYMQKLELKNRGVLAYLGANVDDKYRKLAYRQWISQYLQDVQKFSYVANKEFSIESIDIDTHYRTWPFDLYQKASNVLASASGAVVTSSEIVPPRPSAFSGALAGGAAGALALPGNPLLGALIGGTLGGVGAFFDNK